MSKEDILNKLADAVLRGKMADAKAGAQEALDNGVPALEAINEGLVKGMGIVGDNYAAHKMFLPQVLMSAHTMYAGLDILLPAIPKADAAAMKKAIVAVVEGDVHDIGKNIVKAVTSNYGYRIVDLGKDVATEEVLSAIEKYNADAVGLSALMTTTIDNMTDTVGAIKAKYPALPVMVGGAVVTAGYADSVGAIYSKDARHNVKILENLFPNR